MSHDRASVLSVRFESIELPADASWIESFRCWDCETVLDFSQPNPEDPNRLIGICGDCGHWYLVERPEIESRLLMLELPQLTLPDMNVLAHVSPQATPGRSFQAGA